MTDLRNRVERLERQRGDDGDVAIISIIGGFADEGPECVGEPGTSFYVARRPNESRRDFVARVKVEARAAGVRGVLVVGGFRD